MRVGTICFATDQGLGYLARDFYSHGIVTDPLILLHGRRPDHLEWYPEGTPVVANVRDIKALQEHCAKCDVMLFFETPFEWGLLPFCRGIGVRTVLMPMHECMPAHLPECPDVMLCPSLLDLQVYPNERWTCGTTKSVFLPVPVEVPWRQRTRCEVFVHNAGNGGLRGRNGTKELLDSLQYVKSPAKFIIRSQEGLEISKYAEEYRRGTWFKGMGDAMTWRLGTFPQEEMWRDGDCFVFPEKFNGLSLPLQEARAAGMLVMCTDRFPMNTWLPIRVDQWSLDVALSGDNGYLGALSPLIPVEGYIRSRVAGRCAEFDEAIISPKAIAAKIDEWYGKDITDYSLSGRRWAEANSWSVLSPKYLEVLKGCA